MGGTADPVIASPSGNAWIDGILYDQAWSSGAGTTTQISVYIAGRGGAESVGPDAAEVTAGPPGSREVAAMRTAMAAIEEVCNLRFREVGRAGDADVVWASVGQADAGGAGVLGYAYLPGTAWSPASGDSQSLIALNHDAYAAGGGALAPGGYDFCTVMHELGHALGLSHTHDDGPGGDGTPALPGVDGPWDLGDGLMNQGVFTMMGYNDGWPAGPEGEPSGITSGYQSGPMALDIAALQFLYGVNAAIRTGSDLYRLPAADVAGTGYACLWDGGGADRLVGAASRANTIDLRAASPDQAPGGFVSHAKGVHGGVTIAAGVVIENASGGGQGDHLSGNQAANNLRGLGGDDTLLGREGRDYLEGGDGADRLLGEGGDDRLLGGGGADRLSGGAGRDLFVFLAASDSRDRATCDHVENFAAGVDRLDLSALGGGDLRLDTGGGLAQGELRQTVSGSSLVLRASLDDQPGLDFHLVLDGVAAPLAASDFLL
ncbi:M10 family metallopeptidase [Rubellimicrobium aerolatum]|uniref:M10 family metallopeptidase n=1 Tax=Rubellimicrobium aerolatum TaxID=490979 RepID=A0ABW0SFQ7_9RHOB|nr:M10 family metallopeptidase [Rubellimicrobium aerolatum]MBP1807234.1 serralysin [Rubellimicrobium aerolatum]